jgi:hypothetical protein
MIAQETVFVQYHQPIWNFVHDTPDLLDLDFIDFLEEDTPEIMSGDTVRFWDEDTSEYQWGMYIEFWEDSHPGEESPYIGECSVYGALFPVERVLIQDFFGNAYYVRVEDVLTVEETFGETD